MEKEPCSMSRTALGSVAKLGDLYDGRHDRFCGVNILKQSAPSQALEERDSHFTDTKYFHSDSYSEKFKNMDVKAELKLSVLCGLFTLDGSGRYLKDEKSSARAVRCTLMHNICTKVETLNIFSDHLVECISMDALQLHNATHVVVEISWGANLMVTAEYSNEENRDKLQVAGSLEAELKKASVSISGNAEVDYREGDSKKDTNFSLNVYGDVLPDGGELPQTIEEAADLMKRLPNLVRSANQGKGKPLQYVLLPLSVLITRFKLSLRADSLIKRLDEDTIVRLVHLFDEINEVKQQVNDLYNDIVKHNFCLSDATRKSVEHLKRNVGVSEATLRSKLSGFLSEVRSGKANASVLETFRIEYENSEYSAQNLKKIMYEQFSDVALKIALYRVIEKHGVSFVHKQETSLSLRLLNNIGEKDIYIIFSESKANNDNKDLWTSQLNLFLNLVQQYKTDNSKTTSSAQIFFFVDLDIAPHLAPAVSPHNIIQHYMYGKCISNDVYTEYARDSSICFVKSDVCFPSMAKPNKRTVLEIRCPRSLHGECENKIFKWKCFKCKTEVEWGFDSHFYCECGKGKADSYSYKCTSSHHGPVFEKFRSDETTLEELLGQLKPMKELNILILGETGVGKSTWINGIVNYLSYDTLQEAEEEELRFAIPTSFSVTNDDYEEVIVTTGKDKNENHEVGKSATQYPKSYTFTTKNALVRLIDTPGIGDTRGIAQDKENFNRIMDHLSYVDEIHGICILLKPNNARLTVVFQFCIKELLTHLHRDASKNIVFCFTNARQTFYRPGDTLAPLKRLLAENKDVGIHISKHTMYCMDNEAYRFLAAVKKGIPFSDSDRLNFSASWEKSVEETNRLISHIASLKPHQSNDTLSLNDARRMITELTKPMADISKNIQDNIQLVKDKEAEVGRVGITREDLASRVKIPAVDLEHRPLGYPRTVCSASKCVEFLPGPNNIKETHYLKICHEHCHISGVPLGTRNQTELQGCVAMTGPANNRYCKICGCAWYEHVHQTYVTFKVFKEVDDVNILEQLADRDNDIEITKKFIQQLQRRVRKLEGEQRTVTEVSAEFGSFLKENAITPYNDVMDDYLEYLIRQERDKVALGGDRTTLEGLTHMRSSYKEEVDVLNKAMQTRSASAKIFTQQRIKELANKLYALEISGPKLKKMIEVVGYANRRAATYHEAPLAYRSPAQGKTKSKFHTFMNKIGSYF